MLMCRNDDISDKDYLVILFMHETFRVFRDRLNDQKDRDKFNDMAHNSMESFLQMEWTLDDYG